MTTEFPLCCVGSVSGNIMFKGLHTYCNVSGNMFNGNNLYTYCNVLQSCLG